MTVGGELTLETLEGRVSFELVETVVNVNTASAEQIDELPGIGASRAERIVAHREQHGPFENIDHLMEAAELSPGMRDLLEGRISFEVPELLNIINALGEEIVYIRLRQQCVIHDGAPDGPQMDAVPAGRPLVVYLQWAAKTDEYLNDFDNHVERTLMIDGETIPGGEIIGSGAMVHDQFGELIYTQYGWPIGDVPPGDHEIIFTYNFREPVSDGVDADGDGEINYYDALPDMFCVIPVVEG